MFILLLLLLTFFGLKPENTSKILLLYINHPVLNQCFQHTDKKHEIINKSKVNLGFTKTTK